MKKIRFDIMEQNVGSLKDFLQKNEKIITDADRLFMIAHAIAWFYVDRDFNERKKVIDIVLEKPLDLNQELEGSIPTLLFFAISNACWDTVNYFISKGADIYYKTNYKSYKNINSIEYANILLQEIKTELFTEVDNKLEDFDRLELDLIDDNSQGYITTNEFYAIRRQTIMLKQVIFIDEFLRKYK